MQLCFYANSLLKCCIISGVDTVMGLFFWEDFVFGTIGVVLKGGIHLDNRRDLSSFH